jgi:NAD(P)-dependent dehydrogenase (short-subunit alcohol dehydrogenase family)
VEPVSEPPARNSPVALVVGAGDALGGAIARRFAHEGYVTAVARRSAEKLQPLVAAIEAAGGRALPFGADARREEEIVALFERIEREVGPIEVAVFNIGGNVRFGIVETTARVYAKVWEMACFAGFLTGREAAKVMLPRGRGTILFTGATASLRGGAGFSAFAGAKHGLRALAQSMARELGPQNIHVAHVVVDGAIDTEFIRTRFPGAARAEGRGRDTESGRHRGELLAPPPPTAQRMDLRDGSEAVPRAVVRRPAGGGSAPVRSGPAATPPSLPPPSRAP